MSDSSPTPPPDDEDNAEQLLLESIVNRLADEGVALRTQLDEAVRLLRTAVSSPSHTWRNDRTAFLSALNTGEQPDV